MFVDYCLTIYLDSVHEWNHVRNYWAFFSERYNGFLKSRIKSRSEPHANLVRMMGRLTFVLGMPLRWRMEMKSRWPTLMEGTLVRQAEDVISKRCAIGSLSEVVINSSRRNTKPFDRGIKK